MALWIFRNIYCLIKIKVVAVTMMGIAAAVVFAVEAH